MTPTVFGLVRDALQAARSGERPDTDRVRAMIADLCRQGDEFEATGATMSDGYAAARTSLVVYGEAVDLIDAGELDRAEQVWRRAMQVAGS